MKQVRKISQKSLAQKECKMKAEINKQKNLELAHVSQKHQKS